VEREEFFLGLSCMAVPVDGGMSPFAIGIAAPTDRINGNLETYLDALRNGVANLTAVED
jgi:DNA-binding IclR family transcriptional regulator